jgi:hypothetical protein
MLITPLFVRSSFLLKIIVFFTNVDYRVINIGGQHNNIK